jgi:rare lipoprotein A
VTRTNRGAALLAVLAAMALQWGCASNAPTVRPPADIAQGGVSAHSDRGNPPFYDVLGRRYYVLPTSDGYRARGVASWYGRDFHGLATSSGETYNMNAMTAAHTTLPIPTWVEVTNLENGKHVVVKVNDRGPFVDNRLIDLSYAAALQLDMVRNGTARVEVRALAPPPGAPPPVVTASAPPPVAPLGTAPPQVAVAQGASPEPESSVGSVAGIALIRSADAAPAPGSATGGAATSAQTTLFAQVGAFGDRANAERLVERLHVNGFVNAFVVSEADGRRTLHRVRLGPLRDDQEFDQVRARLRSLGFGESQLVTAR